MMTGNKYYYQYLDRMCWIYRVGDIFFVNRFLYILIKKEVLNIQADPTVLIKSYKRTRRAKQIVKIFNENETTFKTLFNNYIILKKSTLEEKGVLLLKYAEVFEAFIIFSDLKTLFEKYHFVLEMSWDGVCDPVYFMFLNNNHSVFIEATSSIDFNFLQNLNTNLVPVKIAANDWINTDSIPILSNPEKQFDITMVANWSILKNHRKLFSALKKISIVYPHQLKVLLIGFPWANRTKENVYKEYKHILKDNIKKIDLVIREKIPHQEVLECLQRSKMLLLLTYKEGCNQGITEALVCNTPIIVYENIKGGALEKVNEFTGTKSSFKNLHHVIIEMLNTYHCYEPRDYYLAHSGARNSIKKLNDVIKSSKTEWKCDLSPMVNAHGLKYLNESERDLFENDYIFVKRCLDIENKNA
jgi:hypothetical protein